MNAYSIFDDFTEEAILFLEEAGVNLTVHPAGVPRPDPAQMKQLLEQYDCVIIGTSQKISEDMFFNIDSPRIIATASVGVDHIKVPDSKKQLITILNTPKANAQSVAEYTLGCALTCVKRFAEGKELYLEGKNNKALRKKPEDLAGKTIGVVGAGNIAKKIIEYSRFFGMHCLCWTRHPENHPEILDLDSEFVSLEDICRESDIISVNIPNNDGTKKIISESLIQEMKIDGIFISVSRLQTIDVKSLMKKAEENRSFYLCLDIDVDDVVVSGMKNYDNILVTPHIAGGTMETRKRMFVELAKSIISLNTSVKIF